MPRKDELFGEMRTCIKYIQEGIKEMKVDVKEHNNKLDQIILKINEVDKGLSNHLTQHEQLRREMFTKLGLFLTSIGIASAIILKLWLG